MLCTVHPSASVASNHSVSITKSPSTNATTTGTTIEDISNAMSNDPLNHQHARQQQQHSPILRNKSKSRFHEDLAKRSRTPSASQHAGPGKKLRFANSSSTLSSLTDSESDLCATSITAPHDRSRTAAIRNLDPSLVSEPATPPPAQDGPFLTPRSGCLNVSASLGTQAIDLQTEINASFEEDEDEDAEVAMEANTYIEMNHGLNETKLIQVLSNEVEDHCVKNENIRFEPYNVVPELRIFFSQYKQPFQMAFYVERLVQYANCSQAAFISALIYLDRVCARSSALALTEMNCHRLLSTALVLAIKYLDDEVYSNAYYARVSGLTTNELNVLETSMLSLLDWRMSINPALYRQYEHSLFKDAAILHGQDVPATPEN